MEKPHDRLVVLASVLASVLVGIATPAHTC